MNRENAKKIFLAYNEVYQTGIAIKNVDWELIRKDGNKVFVETSTYLMRDSSGQPIGFSGIIHDVSDRRRAEEALKVAEALYIEPLRKDPLWVSMWCRMANSASSIPMPHPMQATRRKSYWTRKQGS
jgi:PAS domain-containing protein